MATSAINTSVNADTTNDMRKLSDNIVKNYQKTTDEDQKKQTQTKTADYNVNISDTAKQKASAAKEASSANAQAANEKRTATDNLTKGYQNTEAKMR